MSSTTMRGAPDHEGANLAEPDHHPYTTDEETAAEEIARVIWIGWDDDWTDLVGEIQRAARRLYAMGYRKTSP